MNEQRKVAVVTGSSSGVGAATAVALAERGWNVVINYSRSREAAESVAERCRERGADALVVQANVAEDADCRRLVQEVDARWGRIDALVNNAGTTRFRDHRDLEGLDRDDFLEIYQVNTIGPYQMTRAVAPVMRRTGGSIVNVASVAGLFGIGSSIAYAASKGALITMTQSLARVLGPEIRVNAVCPGFIQGKWLEQGMGSEEYHRRMEGLKRRAPLQTTATAETVAEGIICLIEGLSLATGETVILDGGAHLIRT